MGIDYQVRRYREGDDNKIVNLLSLVFKDWPGFKIKQDKIGYYRWKYFDNPLKRNSITIAEYQDQIVGCDHGMYREVKIMDQMYLMHLGGDLAVHPNYRRMGIYRKMSELHEKIRQNVEVDLYLGVTTNPIVLETRKKKGRSPFPRNLLEMIYIHDPFKEYIGLHVAVGYMFYKKIKKLFEENPRNPNDFTTQEVNIFGNEADVFWDKIRDKYDFILKRDKANLNWRYCDTRSANYRIFTAMDNGILLGYSIVLLKEIENVNTAFIVDLCAFENDVSKSLLRKVLHSVGNKVNVIKYMVVEGHQNVSMFESLGFIARPIIYDIRCAEKSEKVKTDLSNIRDDSSKRLFLQYGDTDIL